MKELLQAIDFEKCIPLFKKGIASLIICSMLMIDVAKAMDEQDRDPSHLPILQRTPSSIPQDGSSEQSSSDGDSSPRSESPSSTLRTTGLEIIDSRPNSDDSGSSPEKSLLEGDRSLDIIPFPVLSSHHQNIPSALPPSSFPSQQVDLQSNLGVTPSSLQDRVPSPQVFSGPTQARSSSRDIHSQANSRLNEEDPLLDSDPSSFSSSDSDEDSSLEGVPHSEGFPNILPARWKSAPNTIPGTQLLRAGHNSSQLQAPLPPKSQELSVNGDGEIEIVVDNNSTNLGSPGSVLPQLDENLPPPSQSRFLPTCVSNFFSKYTFWPERPKYTLGKVAVAVEVEDDEASPATLQEREEAEALRIVNSAATYFLDSLPNKFLKIIPLEVKKKDLQALVAAHREVIRPHTGLQHPLEMRCF